MSLATQFQAVLAQHSTTIGTTLSYRTLSGGTWSAVGTMTGELKQTATTEERDERSGVLFKRMRAVAKVYDTDSATAPVLKLGDEVIDSSSVRWKIETVDKAEIGNGITRYGLVFILPMKAVADRGTFANEGDPKS